MIGKTSGVPYRSNSEDFHTWAHGLDWVFESRLRTGLSMGSECSGNGPSATSSENSCPTPDASMMNGFVSPGGIAPSGTSPSHAFFSVFHRTTHLRGLNGSPLRLTEARL